jgi:hypothetical protein
MGLSRPVLLASSIIPPYTKPLDNTTVSDLIYFSVICCWKLLIPLAGHLVSLKKLAKFIRIRKVLSRPVLLASMNITYAKPADNTTVSIWFILVLFAVETPRCSFGWSFGRVFLKLAKFIRIQWGFVTTCATCQLYNTMQNPRIALQSRFDLFWCCWKLHDAPLWLVIW